MNKDERVKMVKAMEFITRQINDEDIFASWLYNGVADEDIPYGDLSVHEDDAENFAFYISDEEFSSMMLLFLRLMTRARKSGGLWCDGVLSELE